MSYKMFIVSHKDFVKPHREGYVPIYVGPKDLQCEGEYYTDKTNDNIAAKNPNYCELTALYWIWKNVNDVDYIGLNHYRRYFFKNNLSNRLDNVIENQALEKYLKQYDIILPVQNISTMTIRDEYTADGSGLLKDLETLRSVVNDLYPEYLQEFDDVFNGHRSYLFNMFMMKKDLLNDYCQWLFDILFEVEKRVDLTGYTVQQLRIFGYMSERLMSIYVMHNHLSVKELPVLNTDAPYSQEFKRVLKRKIKSIRY